MKTLESEFDAKVKLLQELDDATICKIYNELNSHQVHKTNLVKPSAMRRHLTMCYPNCIIKREYKKIMRKESKNG